MSSKGWKRSPESISSVGGSRRKTSVSQGGHPPRPSSHKKKRANRQKCLIPDTGLSDSHWAGCPSTEGATSCLFWLLGGGWSADTELVSVHWNARHRIVHTHWFISFAKRGQKDMEGIRAPRFGIMKKVILHAILRTISRFGDCGSLNPNYFYKQTDRRFLLLLFSFRDQQFSFCQIVSNHLYLFCTPGSHATVYCASCSVSQTKPGHLP